MIVISVITVTSFPPFGSPLLEAVGGIYSIPFYVDLGESDYVNMSRGYCLAKRAILWMARLFWESIDVERGDAKK